MKNIEKKDQDFDIKRYRKLFIKAREFGLTSEEKSAGKERLRAFLEANPIKEGFSERIESPFYKAFVHEPIFAWRLRKKMALAMCAFLIMFYGTMTSFAAKSTLPGDKLYPVKVYFNDQLERFFAIGDEKRLKVENEQAMSRLQEIQRLLESRKVEDQKTRDQIENLFEKNKEILLNTSKNRGDQVASKINGTIESVSKLIQSALKPRP